MTAAKLRILFVNSIQMFGGGEVWMLRTLALLKERGHRAWLLCRPGTRLAAEASRQGIPVVTMRMRGDFDPLVIWQVYRLLKRLRVQVVLTNMDKELRFAGIAARLAGVKTVFPRRGIDYPLKNRWRYRFAYTRIASAVIANSQATANALLRNAPWLAREEIVVIHNGIDPAPFAKARPRLREELRISPGAKVVGFVGQLDERKGICYLLKAFRQVHRRHPEAVLLMVGEGPLKGWVAEAAAQVNLPVILAGFRDDVPAVMQSIDLLVLPSLWEGFGIVLIEAMAAGKPVVTTAVSSMPEIVVDGGTGLLVPPADAGALAEAMCTLLADPALRRRMGRAGRARVAAHFSDQRMVAELERLFLQKVRHMQKCC
ncbi:MAG: glycosyltransferase family 4 protein [bacterium]|jgi:glycosyltransferase involved in cell wall biosynthesis|nr:glycosyltransferase family 4 protein [candidate division KSB1 bacterium]MDH7560266.1 glycosyltransferase family 4 protein [bacterium]